MGGGWFLCGSVASHLLCILLLPSHLLHKPMDNAQWYTTSNCQLLLIMQYSCYKFVIFFRMVITFLLYLFFFFLIIPQYWTVYVCSLFQSLLHVLSFHLICKKHCVCVCSALTETPCHWTGTIILSSKMDGKMPVNIHQVNWRRMKLSSLHHWTFLCPLFRWSVLTWMIHQARRYSTTQIWGHNAPLRKCLWQSILWTWMGLLLLIAVPWDAFANSTPSSLEPATSNTSACPRQHLISGWGWWWKTNHFSISRTTYIIRYIYCSACYTRAHVIVAVSVQTCIHECIQHIWEQDGQLYDHWYITHWPSLHKCFSSSKCMDNYVHQHSIALLHNTNDCIIFASAYMYALVHTSSADIFVSLSTQYSCHALNSTLIYMPMIMTKDHLF